MSQPAEDPSSGIGRRRELARREGGARWRERRAQVLAAAAEVFRARGYQAANISDIAARAGVDRANLYYYFASKQEVFLALVEQAVEANVADVEQQAGAGGSATVRLRRVIEALAGSYQRHHPYLHLYVQEDMRRLSDDGPEVERRLRELGRRYDRALSRIAEDGVSGGEFRPDIDPRMLTFAVLGAVNWTHRWFVPGGRLDGGQVGAAFADIFLRGVCTTDPA